MNSKLYLAVIISILFFTSTVYSDTVRLRNGQSITGTIINQSRTTITVRSNQGIRTLAKAQIASIQYGAVPDPQKEARIAREKAAKEAAARRREQAIGEQERRRQAELEQKQKELARKRKEEEEKRREEERKKKLLIAAMNSWAAPKTESSLAAYNQLLRQERSAGTIMLHSGQELDVVILLQLADFFLIQTEFGNILMERDEIEQMEITLNLTGNGEKKTIGPEEVAARDDFELKPGEVLLTNATVLNYREVSFDGYNYFLETDQAGRVRIRPVDIEKKPPNRETGENDFPETLKGMYFKPGGYGYLMTLGGQKIEGKMLISTRHEILMKTTSGIVSVSPEEIVYGRDDPSVKPKSAWESITGFFK